MSLDTSLEEQAILTRLKKFCGGRVYDFIPDDKILELDENQDIKPYITVAFGEPFASSADRSMAGEEAQPHIWVWSVTSWGKSTSDTRPLASAVRVELIGWKPNDNLTETTVSGGGSFSDRATGARPTRSTRVLNCRNTINMVSP